MVTIYSDFSDTKHLQYVANHIFCAVLGTEFTITADKAAFLAADGPCVNYSDADLGHGIQIVPNDSSDIFSASFDLLALRAEYQPTELDAHGRFKVENSPLYRQGLLETPVIDRWAYTLKDELGKAGYSTADFIPRKYRAVCTYDLDFPFKHLKEGLLKFVGKSLRDLSNGNYKLFWERLNTHLRKIRDPYYFAMWRIDDAHRQWAHPYILFKFDKFVPYLKYLHHTEKIGVHVSGRVKRATSESERVHFLKIHTPDTFRNLLKAGFKDDYSLAFANAAGFRSGTAVPHPFYDLERDEVTDLIIHPTVMMDATYMAHQKITPEDALAKIKQLIDACKQSGGDYVSLWHNSNLAGTAAENPWLKVYLESTQYAISLENATYIK
ncbi:hypothetical protein AGMMS4957_01820 [Bacteroidia bacterium]|nr:hypothetical protein AGMMS4957_01820 [Bacteroidia bacterium]